MENNSWNPASHSTRPHCDYFMHHDVFSMKCFVSCSTRCMTICLLMNLETMWLISTKCVGEYVKISGQQSSYAMIMNWSTIQIAKVVMPKTLRNSKNILISLEGLMWNVQKTQRNNNFLWKFVEDKSAPVFEPMWSKIKSNFASFLPRFEQVTAQ